MFQCCELHYITVPNHSQDYPKRRQMNMGYVKLERSNETTNELVILGKISNSWLRAKLKPFCLWLRRLNIYIVLCSNILVHDNSWGENSSIFLNVHI